MKSIEEINEVLKNCRMTDSYIRTNDIMSFFHHNNGHHITAVNHIEGLSTFQQREENPEKEKFYRANDERLIKNTKDAFWHDKELDWVIVFSPKGLYHSDMVYKHKNRKLSDMLVFIDDLENVHAETIKQRTKGKANGHDN